MKYDREKQRRVLMTLSSGLIKGIGTIANKNLPNSHTGKKNGCYPFIPYSLESAYQLLIPAYDRVRTAKGKRPKFLDCGCGIGNIVMLADAIGFEAYGIEFSKKIFNVATVLIDQAFYYSNKRIMHGDILKYEDYDKFDVIYYYCPIANSTRQREFERYLAKNMRIGATVLCAGSSGTFRDSDCFKPTGVDNYMPMFEKIKEV